MEDSLTGPPENVSCLQSMHGGTQAIKEINLHLPKRKYQECIGDFNQLFHHDALATHESHKLGVLDPPDRYKKL